LHLQVKEYPLLDSCHLKIANCCLTIFYKQFNPFLVRNGIFFIILQHTNNLKQSRYEENDSNDARPALRDSAGSVGASQLG
jgi:hypothetical protein